MQAVLESLSLDPSSNDAKRLFHGRGHMFPNCESIVVDLYPPVLLITLFADYPGEQIELLIQWAREQAPKIEALVIQRRYLRNAPSEVVFGELPENHQVSENGMAFAVNLNRAQNSGLFLDMANGRDWLRNNSRGKRVLNLFSYTCSLSVAALTGDAAHVVNFDLSKPALNTGRINHRLNELAMNRVEFFANDILKSWSRIKKKGPFDTVIVDPPTFQKGSFVASKDYVKIIRRLGQLTSPGAIIFAALNAPELDSQFLKDLFQQECPEAVFQRQLETPADFPEKNPEKGLKLLLFSMGGLVASE